jgi:hypothetical protein
LSWIVDVLVGISHASHQIIQDFKQKKSGRCVSDSFLTKEPISVVWRFDHGNLMILIIRIAKKLQNPPFEQV